MISINNVLSHIERITGRALPEEDESNWEQERINNYNNAQGTLNKLDGYNCDICRNKGHILYLNDAGYEVTRPCKCMKTRATLQRAKRSGLGDVLADYTFDKFQINEDWQKNIKKVAQQFCKDDKAKWFYIGGQVGCGKTMICTAITAHYIKAGYETKYMLWTEESKRLKANVNDDSYGKLISQYKDAEVLYIDDFLKVPRGDTPTLADLKLAFEIINHRVINRNAITIISSEKMLDELINYDEATMSRIYQETGIYKLAIEPDSKKNYRLRA